MVQFGIVEDQASIMGGSSQRSSVVGVESNLSIQTGLNPLS